MLFLLYQNPPYSPLFPAEAYLLPALRMSEESLLPQTSAPASPEAAEEAASLLQGKRVVVVEDEGMTQLQLRRILRSEGMEVVGAAALAAECRSRKVIRRTGRRV